MQTLPSPPIVTLSIGSLMVVITTLYIFGKLTIVPCEKDIVSSFLRNFIQVSPIHLFMNLYGLYQFRSVELTLGSNQYLILILILAILQTIIEMIINHFIDLRCSIGFSGILYGLLTWIILSGKQVHPQMLFAVLLIIFTSSAQDSRLSLAGHLMGVFAGSVLALITWGLRLGNTP